MTKDIISIQYLRALAAVMVVFHHLPLQLSRLGYGGPWPTFLDSGVDIFFVISAFIMWTTTYDGRISGATFLYRRLLRIAPLYWALTTVTVVVLVVAPSLAQSGRFDALHVAASYLFLPWLHPVTQTLEPVLVPGWTLNYEMFFYLIFAACLPLPVRWRALAVATVLMLLTCAQPLFPDPQSAGAFYTSGLVLEFAFGIGIGVLFTRGWIIPGPVALALLIAGGGGLAAGPLLFADVPRVLSYGVPAAALVAGAVLFERGHTVPQIAWLRHIGDASYSLYLTHGIVLSASFQIWRKLGSGPLPIAQALYVPFALATVWVIASLVYAWVELPLVRAMRHTRKHRRETTAPLANKTP